MSEKLREVIAAADKLEGYSFECEAGPLKNCVDWDAFKLLAAEHVFKPKQDNPDFCERCGHYVGHWAHSIWKDAAALSGGQK
jgi:hypothetical protein